MKKSILTLAVSLLALLLVNCNGDDSATEHNGSTVGATDSIPTYSPETFEGLLKELNDSRFYCSVPSECPENVGLIFMNMNGQKHFPKIGQCTGFLIADDIFATNSHCIPDRLKKKNVSCENQIGIRFILEGLEKRVYGCKEILTFSKLSVFDPDYAFIKINPTDIKPLKISKNGIRDNQKIIIPKVSPLNYTRGGKLEVETCKIATGSLLNPKSATRWSATTLGIQCDVEGGNSGSPVLNSKNEVLGLMQSKMLDQYRLIVESGFKSFDVKIPSSLPKHTLITNLSCVKDPATQSIKSEECERDKKLIMIDCANLDNEKTNANKIKVQNEWKKDLLPIFIYEYRYSEKHYSWFAHPICVKPKSSFTEYDTYVALKGFWGFREENINLSMTAAISVQNKITLDENLRIEPELGFFAKNPSTFNYNLTKDGTKWFGTYKSLFSKSSLNINFSKTEFPLTLTDCSDEQLKAEEIVLVELSDGSTITGKEYEQKGKDEKKEKIVCEK